MPRSIDRNVMKRPGMAAHFVEETKDALRRGGGGMAQDLALFSRPWGFGPKDIRGVPVFLWHGEADRIVPVAIGRYYAREIPGCQARFYAGEEHLMIVDHARGIFAEVRSAALTAAIVR
jgi:pimeloyl-ACP methyl ester carboxylesterase